MLSRGLVVGDSGSGAPELRENSRYNADGRTIAGSYDIGVDVLSVIVEAPDFEGDSCLHYPVISLIDRFDLYMRGVPGVRSVTSVAGIGKLVISAFNEGNLRWRALPRSEVGLSTGSRAFEPALGLNTEGCRAMAIVAAAAYDAAHAHPDAEVRAQNEAFYEFMVPLVKGYSTEMSLEVTSLGVQVHGGMGFIEETGAAQHYRDAKILTIYEGTTAIQANDLVGRKTLRDGGQTAKAIAQQVANTVAELKKNGSVDALAVAARLDAARQAFVDVVEFMAAEKDPNAVYAGSVPYLMLAGNLMAGWQLARALLVAQAELARGEDTAFMQSKIAVARFYAEHMLSKAPGMRDSIVAGAASVTALPLEAF